MALACSRREARGWGAWPKSREGARRRGASSGVGCFGLDFFFRERSLLWPRLKAAASSCPLLRPWAHTSGCRLQSSFLWEKCKFCSSQRLAHLVQKERAPVSPGAPQLQRDSCFLWSPTRRDCRILPGHSGVAPFCRPDWLTLSALLGFAAF